MSKKIRSDIIIFAVIMICAAAIGILGLFSSRKSRQSITINSKSFQEPSLLFNFGNQKQPAPKPKSDFIAKLFIEGTIQEKNQTYNQKYLLETISKLKNNSKNKGIALWINSPGGAVYQADELYLALEDYKASGKSVYAYFGPIAASGGYYVGCAATQIWANRNCETGSIGVIAGQHVDLSKLMEKYGITSTTIHSGKNKTMGSSLQPMTEEQKKILQSISDECYNQFTHIVSESRKLSKNQVLSLADGRIYSASQAKNLKLIDNIGTFDQMISSMKEKEFENQQLDVVDYKYEVPQDLFYYLNLAAKKFKNSAGFNNDQLPEVLEKAISPDMTYPAYIYQN